MLARLSNKMKTVKWSSIAAGAEAEAGAGAEAAAWHQQPQHQCGSKSNKPPQKGKKMLIGFCFNMQGVASNLLPPACVLLIAKLINIKSNYALDF